MNYRSAAHLNNLGVTFLADGNLKNASRCFHDALTQNLNNLTPSKDIGFPCNVKALTSSCDDQACAMDEFQAEYLSLAGMSNELDKPGRYVHAQGIIICDTPGPCYSTDSIVDTTILSAAIILNLAIVYHLKAIEHECADRRILDKARSFYIKSSDLLSEVGISRNSPTRNPVIDFMIMASLNNLAQLNNEILNYEDSRNLSESLTEFIQKVNSDKYMNTGIVALMEQQKYLFLLNAVLLQPPKLAAAA